MSALSGHRLDEQTNRLAARLGLGARPGARAAPAGRLCTCPSTPRGPGTSDSCACAPPTETCVLCRLPPHLCPPLRTPPGLDWSGLGSVL